MPAPRINPPAILRHWQTWILMMAFVLVPFFIKIPVILRREPVISVLGDRLHIVLLGVITLLLYWKGPFRGKLLWSALVAALIGGAIEFVQILVGRSALIEDFYKDLQGISLVVGYILWRGHKKTVGLLIIAALALLIPWQMKYLPQLVSATNEGRLSFPLLADFNNDNSSVLWGETYSAQVEMSFESEGVLQITGGPPSKWPGAQMGHFPHDWTGYKELVVDARLVNAKTDSSMLAVRIDDFKGRTEKCWITDHFWVGSQWQTFSMPITDRKLHHSERNLDLTDVDKILLFLPAPKDTVQMEFDNLRLR